MTNYDRDRRIKIIVQDPNILPLGSQKLAVYNNANGELLSEVRLGDVFYITINEPTEIAVTKTAWKTGKAVIRAKPHATYKIYLHTGFLTSKIVIKDISNNLSEAGEATEPDEPKTVSTVSTPENDTPTPHETQNGAQN